jgi:TonB family protein
MCLPAQQMAGEPRACPWMMASPDSIDTSLELELTTPSLVGLTDREVVRRREAPFGSSSLARVRLPRYSVEPASPVFPIPAPEYPFRARRAGITDSLKLRFVVDTLGQIDGESVSVIAATYRDFVKSVFATLPRLRFKPAVSGGCAITTRAVIPYSFSLHGISLR